MKRVITMLTRSSVKSLGTEIHTLEKEQSYSYTHLETTHYYTYIS